jgi:hypothetical protein
MGITKGPAVRGAGSGADYQIFKTGTTILIVEK